MKAGVNSEEMKGCLKQVWTQAPNPQVLAVLTAVFHHINVSCVFRQLKIETPCVCDTKQLLFNIKIFCPDVGTYKTCVVLQMNTKGQAYLQYKARNTGSTYIGWSEIELLQDTIAFWVVTGWLCQLS